MRVAIVGLGNQGKKRLLSVKSDVICTVDPFDLNASYKDISEVPLESFDAAFVCTPEAVKEDICSYLVKNSKHVLCEKPLTIGSIDRLFSLEKLALSKGILLYVAYNHRFEPAIVEAKRIINSDVLGKLYSVRLFYGNGTANLVKMSPWRDSGSGVIGDLLPHLLDTLCFWGLARPENLSLISVHNFENNSPDYASISSVGKLPRLELEVTLCKWKNSFRCDILGESGSLHIDGLMKWGSVSLQVHRRVLPSGVPKVEEFNYPSGDPTWELEYEYFKKSIEEGKVTDLSSERYVRSQISSIENKSLEIL